MSCERNGGIPVTKHPLQSDDEDEDDLSSFHAVLSPELSDVRWQRRPTDSDGAVEGETPSQRRKRVIHIKQDALSSEDDFCYEGEEDTLGSGSVTSVDDLENSILDCLDPIPQYTEEEERQDVRGWRSVTIGGVDRQIDMKVIDPYKRVLSHGGYLNSGCHNAIIVFSACYLPHRSRVDYNYVMDNLFCYMILTLEQLVTDDYVLVYLHGGTAKQCIPPFAWIKQCYQVIDRRLRKNLKTLYVVHPTFWLKTLVAMTKLFASSKFSRKLKFVHSLSELYSQLPLEEASVPDRVQQYDRIKQSITVTHV